MNFLAHIYLSRESEFTQLGNFIGDFVKGSNYNLYAPQIRQGILLHRKIDFFTDHHPTVKMSQQRLNGTYGRYNGIVIDIFYDHFLAKNWNKYSSISLFDFAQNFYRILDKNFHFLPEKVKELTPYMVKDNWLYHYHSLEGIQKVMNGMQRRIKQRALIGKSIKELHLYYDEFENDFTTFFDELIQYVDLEKEKLKFS